MNFNVEDYELEKNFIYFPKENQVCYIYSLPNKIKLSALEYSAILHKCENNLKTGISKVDNLVANIMSDIKIFVTHNIESNSSVFVAYTNVFNITDNIISNILMSFVVIDKQKYENVEEYAKKYNMFHLNTSFYRKISQDYKQLLSTSVS